MPWTWRRVSATRAFGGQRLFFAADGRLYGAVLRDDADLGRWSITADVRVCRAWAKWDNALPRGYAVYREGEAYAFEIPERFNRVVGRRTPGGIEP